MTNKKSARLNEAYINVLDKLLLQGTPVKLDMPNPTIACYHEMHLERTTLLGFFTKKEPKEYDALQLENIELYKIGCTDKKGEIETKLVILNDIYNSKLETHDCGPIKMIHYTCDFVSLSYYQDTNLMLSLSSKDIQGRLLMLHIFETKKYKKEINNHFKNEEEQTKLLNLAELLTK